MTTIPHKIIETPDGKTTGSVIIGSEIHMFTDGHPFFKEIIDSIESGDAEFIADHVNLRKYIDEHGSKITKHLAVDSQNRVFSDDAVLEGVMAETLISVLTSQSENREDAAKALGTFIDRIMESTPNSSRDALFQWLKDRNFTYTDDGYFIAYKGVKKDEEGQYVSIHAGHGFVNGEEYHDAHLPNPIGAVVEIPREEVDSDGGIGCSVGLHAGTYNYANNFGYDEKLLVVKIAPEDVVSVPRDCSYQKLRVCKYEVIGTTDREFETHYTPSSFYETDSDSGVEYEECYRCGFEYPEDEIDWDGYCSDCLHTLAGLAQCSGCGDGYDETDLDEFGLCEYCDEEDEDDK